MKLTFFFATNSVTLGASLPFALLNTSVPVSNLSFAAPIHCTRSEEYGHVLRRQDCHSALKVMQETDVEDFGIERVEFLAPDTTPSGRTFSSMVTPRKYSHGRCTIAIALLDFVYPYGDIPIHWTPATEGDREISTFTNLESAARQVLRECTVAKQEFGLTLDGEDEYALGLFVWETGSFLDDTMKGPAIIGGSNVTIQVDSTFATDSVATQI